MSVLAARVRDPQRSATSNADMLTLLSWGERVTNARANDSISSYTLTTSDNQCVYHLNALIPEQMRILSVRDDGRDLYETSYTMLKQTDRSWFREEADRHERYALLGRDILIVHPMVDRQVSLEVRYTELTPLLADDEDSLQISEDWHGSVLDVAEMLIHLRQRNFEKLAKFLPAKK